MKKASFLYVSFVMLLCSFYACDKPQVEPSSLLRKNTLGINQNPSADSVGLNGIYVLSMDQEQVPGGSIGYYDFNTGTYDPDRFFSANGYNIGPYPTDMERYGSKIYVTVTYARAVEVLDAVTLVSQARIPFPDGDAPYVGPSYIASAAGKVFISCADGFVRRIDTSSLTIDGSLFTGGEQMDMAVSGNSLYVNVLHGDYEPEDTFRLPVIDIPSFTLDTTLKFLNQPIKAKTGNDGNVYVHLTADYYGPVQPPAGLISINPTTNIVTDLGYGAAIDGMATRGDSLWVINAFQPLRIYNTVSGGWQAVSYTKPPDMRYTPVRIEVNRTNGDFAILDSQENSVWDYTKFYYYDHSGNMLF